LHESQKPACSICLSTADYKTEAKQCNDTLPNCYKYDAGIEGLRDRAWRATRRKLFFQEMKKPAINLNRPKKVDTLESLCLVKVCELLPPLTHPDAAYQLPLPISFQKALASTRLVKWPTGQLNKFVTTIQAIFADINMPYILAGGYAAHWAGLTQSYTDIDFFTVIADTVENDAKIQALPSRLDTIGLDAHCSFYFPRGVVVKVRTKSNIASPMDMPLCADLVFIIPSPTPLVMPQWMQSALNANRSQEDMYIMAHAIVQNFDLEICKVAGVPCGENLMFLVILAFDLDNEQYDEADVQRAIQLSTPRVTDTLFPGDTESDYEAYEADQDEAEDTSDEGHYSPLALRYISGTSMNSIIYGNSTMLKSIFTTTDNYTEAMQKLRRYAKYGTRVNHGRGCLTSARVCCMVQHARAALRLFINE
jgi:hypothetical protein